MPRPGIKRYRKLRKEMHSVENKANTIDLHIGILNLKRDILDEGPVFGPSSSTWQRGVKSIDDPGSVH